MLIDLGDHNANYEMEIKASKLTTTIMDEGEVSNLPLLLPRVRTLNHKSLQ